MVKKNYGPDIIFPKEARKFISRQNGVVTDVSQLHFSVEMNGDPKAVTTGFSRRLLPKRKVKVGDRFSLFCARTWTVGVNLNGKKVHYRNPCNLMGFPNL